MVDKELIAEIKNSVNIVEVIGEVVSLTKAGRNFLGLCPFHHEKTPSFNDIKGRSLFMVKRLLPLMSLKTNSFTIVSDVVALEMSLSLLRTIGEFPLWMRSRL